MSTTTATPPLGMPCVPPPTTLSEPPVNAVVSEGPVCDWLLVGPFPSPDPSAGEDAQRGAFRRDHLVDLGGERAVAAGRQPLPGWRVQAGAAGVVVEAAFAHAVGYAACALHSDCNQEVAAIVAASGCPQLWFDGALALSSWSRHHPFQAEQYGLRLCLRRGLNRLLLRIDADSRTWSFAVTLRPPPAIDRPVAAALGMAPLPGAGRRRPPPRGRDGCVRRPGRCALTPSGRRAMTASRRLHGHGSCKSMRQRERSPRPSSTPRMSERPWP